MAAVALVVMLGTIGNGDDDVTAFQLRATGRGELAFSDQLPSDPPPYSRRVWYPPTPLPKPAAGRMSVIMTYGEAGETVATTRPAPPRSPACCGDPASGGPGWPPAWTARRGGPGPGACTRGGSVVPSSSPAAVVPDASLELSQGPNPGPVKPFRGEMQQHIRVVDGFVSMYFELRNVGEEPVTFLNTLYDYEPDQLYTPAVRLEWQEGGNLVQTRAGRFFPSPAILQPGRRAPT